MESRSTVLHRALWLPMVASASASIEHHRNEPSHIHHLPPEVFALIIIEDCDQRSYKELFSIRSVCKFWLEVVDATPQLWTTLSLSYCDNLLSLILKNSKSFPLSVQYDDGSCWGRGVQLVSTERITAFLNRTASSFGRWERLRYDASTTSNHSKILGLPLQNLQKLDIALDGNITYTTPLDAPGLKDIRVHRCSLNWPSITQLRSLDIDQNTEGPTVETIKNVLKASPDIEVLRIGRNWPRPDIIVESCPIYLPKLRLIYLHKVSIQNYSHLLNVIVAPNLRNFYFHYTNKWGAEDFTPIFDAAGRYLGAYADTGDENFNREISIRSTDCHLRISTAGRTIDLQNFAWLDGVERPTERTEYVCATFKRFTEGSCNAIRSVVLHGGGNGEIGRYCRIIHSFFPNIAELSVTGVQFEYLDAKAVIEALGTPSDSEEGWTWLLPNLVALRIEASELIKYEDIMGMIEARSAGNKTKSIERVTFANGQMSKGVVDKLQISLGALELVKVDLCEENGSQETHSPTKGSEEDVIE
ncbi:hypothetical protein M407DRAFT_32572 [Tulasnella calospora MUT 4182]|uniref:Uncharacterized protein n=1 Tax=Tulasnella calospora MUT 4182 TaxID=1051891 RepID=A0A0C3PSQ3_9AGAM|nr:hypothetical protein M407DRAFT_32572 [Tulasnella calospora MUT 4182]